MGAWEDGFAAGFTAGLEKLAPAAPPMRARMAKRRSTTIKRAASAYSKKYGRAFKRLAPKYKKKSGGWKKDGFKRCQKAAHKAVK